MTPLLGATLVVFVLFGCAGSGANAIKASRTDYNVALRQTEDEQLLLNLVRLKYRDRPLFLEASSLNTQFRLEGSTDASAELNIGGGDDIFRLGSRFIVEEKPTVTYTPLQGEGYVQRVLTRIPLATLFLLEGSGWSAERVFRTCVNRMNSLRNAPDADGPTPAEAPEYEKFVRACKLLRALELKGMVAGVRHGQVEEGVLLRFEPKARDLPEYVQLMQLLDLDADKTSYPVLAVPEGYTKGALHLSTRSFAGVMYFLSQAVKVPVEDLAAGRVTMTRDASGGSFDWARVTAGLLQIHSSRTRPKNSAVAVFYRQSWFYIDDADLDSKSTFSMLGQLFFLQSGQVKGVTPVLTLPVGG